MSPSAARGPSPTPREILSTVNRTIERERLLGRGERIIVGLSGGPDSVALLRILLEIRGGREWEIRAVHVHHGLRGEEADEDLRFSRSIADGAGVDFRERSISPGPDPSEDRLRGERYRLLASEALDFGARAAAVGHNRGDQAETVLHRIARGSGIRGLAGIPYRRELEGSGGAMLIRPLLDCARSDLIAYLEDRRIPWREDRSNADLRFARNRIRHRVLPILEESLNANVIDALARLSSMARDVLPRLEDEAGRILREGRRSAGPGGGVDVETWRDHPPAVLGEALRVLYLEAGGRDGDFSHEMIEGPIEAIRAGQASYDATWPGGIRARLGGGRLTIGDRPAGGDRDAVPLVPPGTTTCPWGGIRIRSRIVSAGEMEVEGGPRSGGDRAWFDWDALSPPLEVRRWEPRESFRPYGGPSVKEVREVLSDEKVHRADREAMPVVADREGPIWIPGIRRSDRAPIGDGTTRILVLERLGA